MASNGSRSYDEAVALSNCEREPIHHIGLVQSFGAIFTFDRDTEQITHYSENIADLFPALGLPKVGQSFRDYLHSGPCRHAVRNALGLPTISEQHEWLGEHEVAGVAADVGIYQTGNTVVVELQPAVGTDSSGNANDGGISKLRAMLAKLDSGRGLIPLVESATKALRQFTGFDRVMTYRFFPNDDGEVIAEAAGPSLEPYLGLRFPAYDIPPPARQIMQRVPCRIICDIDAPHASVAAFGSDAPLDLSLCHVRGVSSIHIEYLRNMGVQATETISLVIQGQLWGIFALHHYRPRHPAPADVAVADLFSRVISMQIQQEIEKEAAARRSRISAVLDSISDEPTGIGAVFDKHADAINAAAGWDGMASISGDLLETCGDTPTDEAILSICSLSNDPLVSYDDLSSTGSIEAKDLGKTAGAIVQRFSRDSRLLLFRNEIQHELRWAGDPTKMVTYGPNGPRLEPRSSFAEYSDQVQGKCREWTRADESVALQVGGALIGYALAEASSRDRLNSRMKVRQDLLIAELNHRVRNTLALVQSVARQGSNSVHSIDEYIVALEQRIAALSNVHNLVGSSGQQWARISDILTGELENFTDLCPEIVVEGPPIAVRADIAPTVAMMFHELTSNAIRHGVLSGIGERLEVTWKQEPVGTTIRWQERFSKEINPPADRGFGLSLLERAVPHQCGGRSSVQFAKDRLEVELWLPDDVAVMLEEHEDQAHRSLKFQTADQVLPVLGPVLVLEDNTVLAMELEQSLRELDSAHVESVGSLKDAFGRLQGDNFDVALMDINLGEETSFSLAQQAMARGIAVVFVTGYDSDFDLPDNLREIPRVTKPVGRTDLRFAIVESLRLRDERAETTQDKRQHADEP